MKSFAINLILLFCLIQFATSQTTWYKYPGNPVFKNGKPGEWDHVLFSSKKIIFDNNTYRMWYTGGKKLNYGHGSVGYATSKDGIHWEKYAKNPLKFYCEGVAWDTAIWAIDILRKDSIYYMWYHGKSKEDSLGYIGYAWSKDGLNWTKSPEQVMSKGEENDWDAASVGYPIVHFKDNHYHMWYTGDSYTIPGKKRIGYATSLDGIHWKKYPGNPVIDVGKPDSWDRGWLRVYSLVYNGAFYEIWYSGLYNQHYIGFATSSDGINWTKYPGNPVLGPGELGSWDDWFTIGSEVLFQDSVYKMWYAGSYFTGKGEREKYGYATTSAAEARSWDSAGIGITEKKIRVQFLNREEYVKVDSLSQIIQELSGIALVDAYNSLALAYSLNDENKSFSYAEKALELANKNHYPQGKAKALFCMGHCQYISDNFSDALVNHIAALRIFDSLSMDQEAGNLLSLIASIHNFAGSHDLAVDYYKQSMNIFEELNDTIGILQTLGYLGRNYLKLGDTSSAIRKLQKRLALAKTVEDTWAIGSTYQSLGECYMGIRLDSSVYYLIESQKIWDTTAWLQQGFNYMRIAEAYYSFGPEYYKDAEKYFEKCFDYFVFDGRVGKVRFTLGLTKLYLNTGRYTRAREFLDISHKMCQDLLGKFNHEIFPSLNWKLESEITLKTYMKKTYQLYFMLDTIIKDDVSAWKHLALATQWKDSIYNQQNRRQWAMLQGQYETETTRRQIDVLEKENEVQILTIKQSRIYLFAVIGFVLILGVMAILFIRQRKIRMEQKNLFREQKLLHDLELKNVESKKLKELDHLKSRFFANISHEFRTPLTLIKGPLEKALSQSKNENQIKELGIAKKYTGKLQILINNLLTISKLESGKMQLLTSETDIVKLVNNYVQAFESLAKQKDIFLKFKAKTKEIKAFIDQEKFEQVLNNLLSNAFKFTEEGGAIEVAVASRQSAVHSPQSAVDDMDALDLRLIPKAIGTEDLGGQWVNITISDTGRGISPEHIDHIFDRFYQVGQENNSYYEGTGIGLALTKELVELHHGEISVVSEPGKGTSFTITLPLGRAHLQEKEIAEKDGISNEDLANDIRQPEYDDQQPSFARASASNASTHLSAESRYMGEKEEHPQNQPILLIVEDNTDMRAYIREYFESDYHILEAVDGLDGYEKSTVHIPDIIISDVMMPRMDGNEFCKKVKTDERTSHIPVILLTARDSSEFKIEGLETGADDYISKPFDPKEIQVRVKNLIEQRKMLREKFVADFWKGDQSPTIQIPVSDLNLMDKKFLQKALETVNQHLSDAEFDVNLFSQEMAMSRQQMHRKFRAVVDQSATEFIRVIRLKKAAELLSKKSGTVSEIAYDVGFNTPYYFTKTFKEQYGLAPSEYAEKFSKGHK